MERIRKAAGSPAVRPRRADSPSAAARQTARPGAAETAGPPADDLRLPPDRESMRRLIKLIGAQNTPGPAGRPAAGAYGPSKDTGFHALPPVRIAPGRLRAIPGLDREVGPTGAPGRAGGGRPRPGVSPTDGTEVDPGFAIGRSSTFNPAVIQDNVFPGGTGLPTTRGKQPPQGARQETSNARKQPVKGQVGRGTRENGIRAQDTKAPAASGENNGPTIGVRPSGAAAVARDRAASGRGLEAPPQQEAVGGGSTGRKSGSIRRQPTTTRATPPGAADLVARISGRRALELSEQVGGTPEEFKPRAMRSAPETAKSLARERFGKSGGFEPYAVDDPVAALTANPLRTLPADTEGRDKIAAESEKLARDRRKEISDALKELADALLLQFKAAIAEVTQSVKDKERGDIVKNAQKQS